MLYEARQAEISDQRTRMKSAEHLLGMGLTVDQIAKGSELPMAKIIDLKNKMNN